MQAAEGSVLLTYRPGLPVELNFNDILGIRAMINFILNHLGINDIDS